MMQLLRSSEEKAEDDSSLEHKAPTRPGSSFVKATEAGGEVICNPRRGGKRRAELNRNHLADCGRDNKRVSQALDIAGQINPMEPLLSLF